jgi:hypothetical protein
MTPAIWAQFYSWYVRRAKENPADEHYPVYTDIGVWIVADEWIEVEVPGIGKVPSPLLIAGCCLYPSNVHYCVVEFVSTNPDQPAKVCHAAVQRICAMVSNYGAMQGKTMICFPKHKGVKRLMEKFGYNPVKPEVEVKWSPIYVGVGVYEGKKTELTSPAATMDSQNAAE